MSAGDGVEGAGSMSTEWLVEEREPGWLARLIAPVTGGRPIGAAAMVGALAAVAFVLSMIFDWGTVTVIRSEEFGTTNTYPASVGNLFNLGLVYMVGGVALLGLVGATVTTPELALRVRPTMIGVTVGLLGVVIAATAEMARLAGAGLEAGAETKSAIELGLFFAYAAVVLPLVSVWLAARPLTRSSSAASTTAKDAHDEDEDDEDEDVEEPPARYDGGRGLTVTGGGPMDLTVTPG